MGGKGDLGEMRTEDPVKVVADDREERMITELQRWSDMKLEVRRLEVGDFLVEDRVVVERKTLGDFATSVVDGRLFRQAGALAQFAGRAIFVLENDLPGSRAIGVPREALQGALITINLFYGLPVLRARDPAETARLLVYIGRQVRQVAAGSLSRPGSRPRGRRARQLFILQGLPGVGPDRAHHLLEHFGSVANVAQAAEHELAVVAGIGEATARKIRWALG